MGKINYKMPSLAVSVAVLLGYADAVAINKFKNTPEPCLQIWIIRS